MTDRLAKSISYKDITSTLTSTYVKGLTGLWAIIDIAMMTPKSSQVNNNNNNAFIAFIKCLWYANIMLSIFYVKSFWLTVTVGSIITLLYTNKKKLRLREIKRLFLVTQMVSGRVLLVQELVIPTIYYIVFLWCLINCLNRHGIISIHNTFCH